ncbi:SET domain-containing protein [Colletotrichum truncatum]|uniref:SET domain-containing protein n=1 Tax=Colletotrichum truncatum TaxID=5467 RepID=A0ACC3YQH9_COLTU|nr:SET domain-containing protein [Colletotrichum truncatum]KAF6796546.1 SET domain-containing protein [Colletotrichum truncatum]
MAQPRNWPLGLLYLPKPMHSRLLSESQRMSIGQQTAELPEIPAHITLLPSPLVKITPITDFKHPAKGQFGLFAARHIKPGTFIIPYLGTVHPDVPSKSDYDLWLDREAEIAVDASENGNEARFINDYRGVAERPNAEFREVWSHKFRQRCMAVFVLPEGKNGRGKGGIGKGEEILVSYGKGFWGHRMSEE